MKFVDALAAAGSMFGGVTVTSEVLAANSGCAELVLVATPELEHLDDDAKAA
jgi:hypothetical protein